MVSMPAMIKEMVMEKQQREGKLALSNGTA